jgi:hypothetical protein
MNIERSKKYPIVLLFWPKVFRLELAILAILPATLDFSARDKKDRRRRQSR